MYVDCSTLTRGNKSYTRYLLRECYRENGKNKNRTIASISHCTPEEIEALRLALRNKKNIADLKTSLEPQEIRQGKSFGAVWVLLAHHV